jgi:hypothetical protein
MEYFGGTKNRKPNIPETLEKQGEGGTPNPTP